MDVLKKTPVREQDAKVRATNFERSALAIMEKKQKKKRADVSTARMPSV